MGVFSFVKAGKKIFGKPKSTGSAIKSVKPNVPSTRLEKAGKVPTTPKEKSLAKLAPPKDKITFGDVIAGRTKKAGGGPAMSKLPAKEERKQKAQKRMTAANKFVKNRKRSFGSIMREKHMR
jgi:hypothetical protein